MSFIPNKKFSFNDFSAIELLSPHLLRKFIKHFLSQLLIIPE